MEVVEEIINECEDKKKTEKITSSSPTGSLHTPNFSTTASIFFLNHFLTHSILNKQLGYHRDNSALYHTSPLVFAKWREFDTVSTASASAHHSRRSHRSRRHKMRLSRAAYSLTSLADIALTSHVLKLIFIFSHMGAGTLARITE